MVDEITGLPSRKFFFRELSKLEEGKPVIILLLDIDDFRFVNFTYGYRISDSVLKAAGQYFQRVLNKFFSEVFLARVGANCFGALIKDEVPLIRVEEVFNRYLHLVEFKLKSEFVRLTTSAGVSVGVSRFEEVFSQAETSLYSAKESGKNTIVVFQKAKAYDIEKFKNVRQKLIQAIHKKTVVPHFQPIVSLRTGKIYGYEVLSRIFVGDEVLRGDYVFLVADTLALTPEIDKLLFMNAIKYFGDYKLFFNLSMKYFFRELNAIFQIAKKYNLDLSNVIFEITESQKLMEEGVAVSLFSLFKEFNAGIAVDDFGAGYSNFMYLKKFPADVLKIDGAFVRGAKESTKDLTIIKAIVNVAKAFRLRTLAEFIEDEETYRLMRSVGVSLGQGFFIGKPEPEPKKVEVNIT